MLVRAGVIAALLLASTAPLQCGHTPEAELREDETPGDALWRLAQKFHDSHDAAAEKATLRYLVERYPDELLSALRFQFGGHKEKAADSKGGA